MNEIVLNSEQLIIVPKTVTEYLYNKHETIVNDYKTPDGKYSEHCGLIALEIADLLIADGHTPSILEVKENFNENGFIHSKSLLPKIYEGRVSWGAHQICSCDGLIFDPILDRPIKTENYTKEVFGEDIKTGVIFSPEETKEAVSRLAKK